MPNITKISLISIASCFLFPTLAQAQLQHSISPVEPLEDREVYKGLQAWFIEQLVYPVYTGWLEMALLAGQILISGRTPARCASG